MADLELNNNMNGSELMDGKPKPRTEADADSGLDDTSDSTSSHSEEYSKASFSSDSDDSETSGPTAPKRKSKTGDDCHVLVTQDGETIIRVGVPDETTHALCQIIEDRNIDEIKIDQLFQAEDIAVLEIDEPVIVNICQTEDSSEVHISEYVRANHLEEQFPQHEYFNELATKAQLETVDFDVSLDDKPEWLDEEKYKRGQKFAQKYLFCLNFAEMLSLLMLFSIKSALAPLILTGRSTTPFKAFQRYLSTFLRLQSWYEGDVWNDKNDPARKNISVVKAMHRSVFKKLTETCPKEIEEKTTLGDERGTALWCPMKDTLREDFQGSCPMAIPGFGMYDYSRRVWVNQMDMAATQFGFVGLAVTYPKRFGIHGASDEDLEAFLHMWRGIGYLLGIKDQYNFCNGNLETVRQRTKTFIDLAIRPSFREVNSDWEHMCRCLIQGIAFYIFGLTFEVSLQFLADVLNIHTPRLKKSFTWFHKIMYALANFVFKYLFRVPGVLAFNTSQLKKSIKMAQDASPEKLAEWEKKKFSYMNQPDKKQVL